jgi:ATP-dependent Lon protease
MTGEITLRGKVMPVGGIKEKVLAAYRVGLKTVLLPKRNEADLEDLPEEVRQAINFVFLDMLEDALDVALEPAQPSKKPKRKTKKKAVPEPET